MRRALHKFDGLEASSRCAMIWQNIFMQMWNCKIESVAHTERRKKNFTRIINEQCVRLCDLHRPSDCLIKCSAVSVCNYRWLILKFVCIFMCARTLSLQNQHIYIHKSIYLFNKRNFSLNSIWCELLLMWWHTVSFNAWKQQRRNLCTLYFANDFKLKGMDAVQRYLPYTRTSAYCVPIFLSSFTD